MKKLLSTLLSAAMVFTLLPFNISAANTAQTAPSGSSHIAQPEGSFTTNEYPAYPNEGFVRMEKSAAWDNQSKTTATVTLSVFGKGIKTGVDAVLVIDRSSSMDEDSGVTEICAGIIRKSGTSYLCDVCGNKQNRTEGAVCGKKTNLSRLVLAKRAANTFVNTMFAQGVGGAASLNRIGLVSFCGSSKQDLGISSASAKDTLTGKINALTLDNGTNYSRGLSEAKAMLDGRSDKTRPAYVIFLTDGEPNEGGDGSTQAAALKNTPTNAIIYSVALSITNNQAISLLRDKIASNNTLFFNAKDPSTLSATFAGIAADLKKAGTNVTVTDWVNASDFELNGAPSFAAGRGTVSTSGNKVTVGFSEITDSPVVIKIPLRLKNPARQGLFPTNDPSNKATVQYTNYDGKSCFQKAASPELAKPLGMIFTEYYEVNENGEPTNASGAIPFEARTVLREARAFEASIDGKPTTFLPDGTYAVTAEPTFTAPSGQVYKLAASTRAPGSVSPQNTTVQDSGIYTVYFGYQAVTTATVTFDKNAADATGANPASVTVGIGKSFADSGMALPSEPVRSGYQFDGWYPNVDGSGAKFLPTTTVRSNTTLYAKWVGVSAGYTVKYLLASGTTVLAPAKTVTTTKVGDSISESAIAIAGYKCASQTPISGSISADASKNIFYFYYEIDPDSFTAYSVAYYRGGETSPIAVVPGMSVLNGTDVRDAIDLNLHKPATGYQDGVITSASTVIDRENTQINVLYTAIPVETISYSVAYYQDSETNPAIVITGATVPVGTDVRDAINLNLHKPATGYQDGVITSASTVIDRENTQINVLYTAIPIEIIPYSVAFYQDDLLMPNATLHKSGAINTTGHVTETEIAAVLSTLNNYQVRGINPAIGIPLTSVSEANIIRVYFAPVPIAETDSITIVHNYYLNDVLQSALTSTELIPAPLENTSIDTTSMRRPNGGYTFSGVLIRGLAKMMPSKDLGAEQDRIDALNSRLAELIAQLDTAKAGIENADALLEEYSFLTDELASLNEERVEEDEKKTDKEETASKPESSSSEAAPPSSSEPESSMPESSSSAESIPPEESSSSTESVPPEESSVPVEITAVLAAEVTAEVPVEPSSSETISSEETTPAAGNDAEDEDTLTAAERLELRKQSIRDELTDIKGQLGTLLELQREIDTVRGELETLAPATPYVHLPEVTFTESIFEYSPYHLYTVTISYSKTTATTSDNDDDDDNFNNNPYIDLPQKRTALPKDLIAVLDEAPLDNLPKSGGAAASASLNSGLLALVLSALLKLLQKH